MWKLLKDKKGCQNFLEAAEAAAELRQRALLREEILAELPPSLQSHSQTCRTCAQKMNDLIATRNVLRDYAPHQDFDAPWFAARVMARISSEEGIRKGQEALWNLLPRLASRVAGIAVVILILAGGWLIRQPAATSATGTTVDTLFDTPRFPVTHDEALASVLEKAL